MEQMYFMNNEHVFFFDELLYYQDNLFNPVDIF